MSYLKELSLQLLHYGDHLGAKLSSPFDHKYVILKNTINKTAESPRNRFRYIF